MNQNMGTRVCLDQDSGSGCRPSMPADTRNSALMNAVSDAAVRWTTVAADSMLERLARREAGYSFGFGTGVEALCHHPRRVCLVLASGGASTSIGSSLLLSNCVEGITPIRAPSLPPAETTGTICISKAAAPEFPPSPYHLTDPWTLLALHLYINTAIDAAKMSVPKSHAASYGCYQWYPPLVLLDSRVLILAFSEESETELTASVLKRSQVSCPFPAASFPHPTDAR